MRRLYLVHEDSNRLRCAFYTVVVLNATLAAKYTGGIAAFVEQHGPRCNNDICATCHMGDDVDLVVEDLVAQGCEHGSDFVCFDAGRMLLEAAMMGVYQRIDFQVPWLVGAPTREGLFVWFRNQ